MTGFVPGGELSEAYYREVVRPILEDVRHSAGLIGWGSDVLGFDTVRSTDHGWGPRLSLFVAANDVAAVKARLQDSLPETFRGWPTAFGWDDTPVTHHVAVDTVEKWLRSHLGFDPRRGMETLDWLTTPQQALLELTAGPVFHDGLGELEPVRAVLAWYPDDVWLWMIAAQWRRVSQEEAFIGRTAEVGDELGSRIVAARLARDLVRMCLLQERTYAPYSKWLGSAFARLHAAAEVGPPLERALAATDVAAREDALVEAVEAVARRHNGLGLTAALDPTARRYHGRPYRVIDATRFAEASLDRVEDPWLRALPPVGAIDQFVDSTDALTPARARTIGRVLRPEDGPT